MNEAIELYRQQIKSLWIMCKGSKCRRFRAQCRLEVAQCRLAIAAIRYGIECGK